MFVIEANILLVIQVSKDTVAFSLSFFDNIFISSMFANNRLDIHYYNAKASIKVFSFDKGNF